jgi:acyl-ACP thioesterase
VSKGNVNKSAIQPASPALTNFTPVLTGTVESDVEIGAIRRRNVFSTTKVLLRLQHVDIHVNNYVYYQRIHSIILYHVLLGAAFMPFYIRAVPPSVQGSM